MHAGLDLIAPPGTAVLAMAARCVLLEHGGGWQSLYLHLFPAGPLAGAPVQQAQGVSRALP